mgnify:CR=1 FL=1
MKPKTFEHFPKEAICPICHTNNDEESILIPIDGTSKDGICESIPIHLWCAIVKRYNSNVKVFYITGE